MPLHKTQQIFLKIERYAREKGFNLEKIREAYELASELHKDQKRKSGEPYIIHPVTVAYYLTQYGCDEETLIAGLLHDAVEDTPLTVEAVEEKFGKAIAQLIDGSTKFDKEAFLEEEDLDRNIESLRKLFSIMQKDIRIAIMKLADRLHNMETLQGIKNPEKQQRIAKETLNVFVKLAEKLSLSDMKSRLSDLCLFFLDLKNFRTLEEIQKEEIQKGKKFLVEIKEKLLGKDQIPQIIGITQEIPNLFKMYQKKIHETGGTKGTMPFTCVIVTKNIKDCYEILYHIHKLWEAEDKKFEDFISSPASNGYRGLHTTALSSKRGFIRFKIRTEEMDAYSNRGVTLYCFKRDTRGKRTPVWLKNLSHVTQQDKNKSGEFWNQLQSDILEKYILVHTERGNILLPARCTALDAGFQFYGKKTWQLEKVSINGILSALYTPLKENDTVYFEFSPHSQIHHKWLEYADTASAHTLIKEGLQKIEGQKKLVIGKRILEQEFLKSNLGFLDEMEPEAFQKNLEKYKLSDVNSLYKKIAEGTVKSESVVDLIKSTKKHKEKLFRKSLKLSGTTDALYGFFSQIPNEIKQKLYYSLPKGTLENTVAKFTFERITQKEWQTITTILEREDGLECLQIRDISEHKIILYFSVILSLLWAFDPIVATIILQKTPLTPFALTSLRFWSISLALILFLGTTYLVQGKSNKKIVPFLKKRLLLISVCLLGTGFASYMALENNTPPSDYMLALGLYISLFLTFKVMQMQIKKTMKIIFSYAILGMGFWALFTQSTWQIEGKLWMIAVVVFFSLYSILSEQYQVKFKILSRYLSFQLYLAVLCSLFSLILLPLFPWPNLSPEDYISVFSYSIVFTGIPYAIYSYLLKTRQDIGLTAYGLTGSLFVVFVGEMFLLKIFPNQQSLLSLLFIALGIGLLAKQFQPSTETRAV